MHSSPGWPPALYALAQRLQRLQGITDLFVGGSLASGDYRPGVSDIDLVAITDEHVAPDWPGGTRIATLTTNGRPAISGAFT